MEKGDDYTRLIVWQHAMALVDAVYDATEDWPKKEEFGLTNQTRRAVVSVPANIAEGKGVPDFANMHITCQLLTAHCGKSRRFFESPLDVTSSMNAPWDSFYRRQAM
jgi:hypothetical protein